MLTRNNLKTTDYDQNFNNYKTMRDHQVPKPRILKNVTKNRINLAFKVKTVDTHRLVWLL